MWKEPEGDPSVALPGHQLSTLPARSQALLPVAGTQGSGDSSLPSSQRLGTGQQAYPRGSSSAPSNRAQGAADRAGPPTSLAPGEGGVGRALGLGPAHRKCPEMVCPEPGNWSITASPGAPAEDRVAEGPWAAADSPEDTTLAGGGWPEVGPGGSASRPAELRGGSLRMPSRPPTGDRTRVTRGSASQGAVAPSGSTSCRGMEATEAARGGGCGAELCLSAARVLRRGSRPTSMLPVTALGALAPAPLHQLRARRYSPRRGAGRRTPATGTGAEMPVGARPRLLSHAVPQRPCFRPRPS